MKTNRQIWAMPVVLGVLTMIGLLVALVADGIWDLVSVAVLALPVLVGCWYAFRPTQSPH